MFKDFFSLTEEISNRKIFQHSMLMIQNSIRDAQTSQPGEIVFNTMTYESRETVQRLGYFQRKVTRIKVQIMFK